MLTVESVTNPVWVSPEHTMFNCDVKFAQFAEVVPFGCFVDDVHGHSKEIWSRAMRGEFGAIAEYIDPTPVQQPATEPQPQVGGAQTL